MYPKEITYTDFNDVKRTETYYFNMTKPEMMDWVNPDITANDIKQDILDKFNFRKGNDIMSFFEQLILRSYGQKSEDGRSFIKFDENGRPLANAFKQTAAYTELYMQLISNPDAANEFMYGIMPAQMAEQARASLKNETAPKPHEAIHDALAASSTNT